MLQIANRRRRVAEQGAQAPQEPAQAAAEQAASSKPRAPAKKRARAKPKAKAK